MRCFTTSSGFVCGTGLTRQAAPPEPIVVVVVTGGREWAPTDEIEAWFLAQIDEIDPWALLHGDAEGADRWAADIVRGRPLLVLPHRVTPEDWRRLGRRAGHERNELMAGRAWKIARLGGGRPALLALPGDRGTRDMIRVARARSIEVRRPPGVDVLDGPQLALF